MHPLVSILRYFSLHADKKSVKAPHLYATAVLRAAHMKQATSTTSTKHRAIQRKQSRKAEQFYQAMTSRA